MPIMKNQRSSFRLPNIQELSKQQYNALNLPLDGQHLIVGGPGTGKSVVALLRAERLGNEKKNYLFLVYNVLLDKNSYALGGANLKAVTWKKWFKKSFKEWFGLDMPTLRDDSGNDNEDWESIKSLKPLEEIDTSLYLVIDEGQDMPPEFYETLIKIGFENFYVVADQNQRITELNSSRAQIEQAFCLNSVDTLELTDNYRNSFPIARLAQTFFTNDPASPPVQLPTAKEGELTPRMMEYGKSASRNISGIITQILNTYDRNINKLVCVITADDSIRSRFCELLQNAKLPQPLGHEMPKIQTYSSKEIVDDGSPGEISSERCPRCGGNMILRKNSANGGLFLGCSNYPNYPKCTYTKDYVSIEFQNGGIAVINQQSVKGLEFDTVYVANIDRYWGRGPEQDELKKKFYVMVSRARDDVILLRNLDDPLSTDVETILTKDATVLERR